MKKNLLFKTAKHSKTRDFFTRQDKIRFYVNSWGRAQNEKAKDRVGARAPARFLCIAEKDSLSKIIEVSHTKTNPFQNLRLIITAFNVTIRPGHIH